MAVTGLRKVDSFLRAALLDVIILLGAGVGLSVCFDA